MPPVYLYVLCDQWTAGQRAGLLWQFGRGKLRSCWWQTQKAFRLSSSQNVLGRLTSTAQHTLKSNLKSKKTGFAKKYHVYLILFALAQRYAIDIFNLFRPGIEYPKYHKINFRYL